MPQQSTSSLPVKIGAELRRLRGGHTLATVGAAARSQGVAGVEPATLSKWENGRRNPGRLSLTQLAFLLEFYGATQLEIADLIAMTNSANAA